MIILVEFYLGKMFPHKAMFFEVDEHGTKLRWLGHSILHRNGEWVLTTSKNMFDRPLDTEWDTAS